jgi:Domain of unknown function (DUF5666)
MNTKTLEKAKPSTERSNSKSGGLARKSKTMQLMGWGLALSVLLQAGCGGGGSSTSANGGAGGSQVASGTVTGFGSVLVDGVEIEDVKAAVQTDKADGTVANVSLQLGQHVRVSHDGKGTASKIAVDAAIVGVVSAVTADLVNTMTVAAQDVKVNTADVTLPITHFGGGYSSLNNVMVGDVVEVHGTPVYNGNKQKYEIQATRIQKQTGVTGFRVLGLVSSLNTTSKTFVSNGLTVNYGAATLSPNVASLLDGKAVLIFATSNSALVGTTLTATRVKVIDSAETYAVKSLAQVSGMVSSYSQATGTFVVQGLTVNIGKVAPTPSGSVVSNNAYVRVEGEVTEKGEIAAKSIRIRANDTGTDLASVKVIGPINGYDVETATMVVRGVPVDVGSSALVNTCKTALVDGLVVEVKASTQANTDVVLAKSIGCQPVAGTVVERFIGTPSNINTSTKTFSLTTLAEGGVIKTRSVQWNEQTVFEGMTIATLTNITTAVLLVDGYVSNGGIYMARTIRIVGGGDGDKFLSSSKTTNRLEYRKLFQKK